MRRSKQASLTDDEKHFSRSRAQANDEANPLFPITAKMKQRIKRMKQRMLATLKLSEKQLSQRCARRVAQTRQSRPKAEAEYRSKEIGQKLARTNVQRTL